MAYTAGYTPRDKGFGHRIMGFFATLMARIGAVLVAYAEAQSRIGQVKRLEALSDEELAKRGISRDRIVHYVFRDRLSY